MTESITQIEDCGPSTIVPPAVPLPSCSIFSITNEAWELCDHDDRQTAIEVRELLLNDIPQLVSVLDALLYSVVRDVRRAFRISYFQSPSVPQRDPGGAKRRLKGVARDNEKSWLDYPLSCGVNLGKARRPQVRAQVEVHHKNEISNAVKKRLFAAVLRQLPDDKKQVEEVLTSEEIEQLKQEESDE